MQQLHALTWMSPDTEVDEDERWFENENNYDPEDVNSSGVDYDPSTRRMSTFS